MLIWKRKNATISMRTFRTLTMLKKPAAFGDDLPSKLNFMHISNSIAPIDIHLSLNHRIAPISTQLI